MRKTLLSSAVATVILAAVPLTAMSYEGGDFILRAGAAKVSPNDDSSSIYVQGLGGKVPGTGVGVESETQVGITATYMLNSNWGIELLASTPFEHDLTAKGLGGFGISDIGSVTHLPPTLSIQNYFLGGNGAFQPYVGAGINYTLILDEDLSGQMKNILGARSMDIDDSIGFSVQAGFDYALSDKWLLNAAVWRMEIDTTAKIKSDVGNIKVDVDVDPWVYMVSLGYKF
ncbi:MAG: OmpW family outer membrane protein [Oceanicoccus sp.]